MSDLPQLAELKHECETRGLDVKGNKVELITRLQAHLEEHGEHAVMDGLNMHWVRFPDTDKT